MKLYRWAYTCRTFCAPKDTLQTCLSSCILTSWLYTLHSVIYRQPLGWGHRQTKSGMGTCLSWDSLGVNPCFSIHGSGCLRPCRRKSCSVKLGQCMNCWDNRVWSIVFSSFPHFSRIKHSCRRVTYVPRSNTLHFFIPSPWCHWICCISLLLSTVNVLSCSSVTFTPFFSEAIS